MPLRAITRHILGLYHGCPGARTWRRYCPTPRCCKAAVPRLLLAALREVEPEAVADPA